MKNILVAPSLMCADQLDIGRELEELKRAGADYIHIDVMDGCFVPNIQLGTELIRSVKRADVLPLDIHLMITEPEKKLDMFCFGEGDIVSIHYEAASHPLRALEAIKSRGAKAFLALNPKTPTEVLRDMLYILDGVLIMTVEPGFAGQRMIPSACSRISRVKQLILDSPYPDILIEADGNISFDNVRSVTSSGADMLVAGTASLFSGKYNYERSVNLLKGNDL